LIQVNAENAKTCLSCVMQINPLGAKAMLRAATAREALGAIPWLDAVPKATLDLLAEQSVLHRMPAGSQPCAEA